MYGLVKPPTVTSPIGRAGAPLQRPAGGQAGWARAALTQAEKGAGKTGGTRAWSRGAAGGWRSHPVTSPCRLGGRSGVFRTLIAVSFSFLSTIKCMGFYFLLAFGWARAYTPSARRQQEWIRCRRPASGLAACWRLAEKVRAQG